MTLPTPTVATPGVTGITHRVDPNRIVKLCGERQVPAKVLLYEPSELFEAKFVGPSILQMLQDVRHPILPGALANISFQLGGRTGVYLARVTDFKIGDLWPRLHISRPAEVMLVESRRSLRFPVAPVSGLVVRLLHDGQIHEAIAEDISMGGISACLNHRPDWPLDAEVLIQLVFEGRDVRLPARLARQTGLTVGLAFTELQVGDDVAGLTHLVCELERRWLEP